MRDRWVPYPFQSNIHRLPDEDIAKCLDGLVAIQGKHKANKPENFYEWLHQGFGDGLMEIFMVPYNEKVWACHPKDMNVEWMGERVATVDLKQVIQNIST
jgi:protoporphyrinogen oxidase